MQEPEEQMLAAPQTVDFLSLWALSSDSLFGGSSHCELGLSKEQTRI